MKCKECEFLGCHSSRYGTRKTYICGHPASSKMYEHCQEHNINKAPTFLCYGDLNNGNQPSIKTSPKYCPIKLLEAEERKERT